MAYPIITLLFAAGVAFLAFRTNGAETGMEAETAPVSIDTAPPAEAAPADDSGVEEEDAAE